MKENDNNINEQPKEIMDEELFEERTKSYSIVTLSIIILVSIGLMIAAWYIYKSYQTKNYDEVVVVSADQDEIKVQPSDPGGMVVNNMDKDDYDTIDKNRNKTEKAEILLPPAEEPINKKDLLLANMSPAVKKLEELPVANEPAPVAQAAPTPVVKIEEPKALVMAKEEPKVITASPKAEEKKSIKSTMVIKAPVVEPKEELTEKTEEYIKPVTKKDPKSKPQFAKKLDKFYKVQIASFKSVSEAEREWKNMSKRFSKILDGYQYYIVSKDIEGKGIFQRLQVGPFESESDAKKACSSFKDAGMNCFIIKP